MSTLERISIELSTLCDKACAFCYSHSSPQGGPSWDLDALTSFAIDCASNGIRAISLGGGEPLQYPGLFELLAALQGHVFRSFTTNGLLLDERLDQVVAAAPDKVHVSIHFPGSAPEVRRVVRQVCALQQRGIRSGVNLLVDRRQLEPAARAIHALRDAGIGLDRIVLLPMRGQHTPSPQQLAAVAGTQRFQSMTCLLACGRSPRFASIAADQTVAWCSYTSERRALPSLDHAGLLAALDGLGLVFCGGTPGAPAAHR